MENKIKEEIEEDPLFEKEIDFPCCNETENFSSVKDPLEVHKSCQMENVEIIKQEERLLGSVIDSCVGSTGNQEPHSMVNFHEVYIKQENINEDEENILEDEPFEEEGDDYEKDHDVTGIVNINSSLHNSLGYETKSNVLLQQLKKAKLKDKSGNERNDEYCTVVSISDSSLRLERSKNDNKDLNDVSFVTLKDLVKNNSSLCSANMKNYLKCNYCPKKFKFASGLDRHEYTHTGEKPYTCENCQKSFSTNIYLSVHTLSHAGERPYSCDICKKSFKSSNILKCHTRIHADERPFTCTLCGKSFIYHSRLSIHMRAHTGDRPYICDQCSKTFITANDLKVHTRIHSGERPYSCSHCKKSFVTVQNLNVHVRTHTGERPYTCEQCEKSFASAGVLKRHMRTHNDEKT